MMRLWIWLAFVLGLSVQAKTFENSYIRFELPESWSCNQENVAYVCSPLNPAESREALIVVTAKIAGPEDNLNSFYNYLRKPKTLITQSKTSLSQPVSIGRTKTAGLEWIEAVHNGSEVPGFTTRYLAGVKGQLALLLSFSADQGSLSKFEPIFKQAIRTIQVDASKPVLLQAQQRQAGRQDAVISGTMAGRPGYLGSVNSVDSKRKKLLELAFIGGSVLVGLALIRKFV